MKIKESVSLYFGSLGCFFRRVDYTINTVSYMYSSQMGDSMLRSSP